MADVNNNPLTAGIRWRQGTCLDATAFTQYQAVKLTGPNLYAPCATTDSDADVAGIVLADRLPGQARSIPIALLTSDVPIPVLSDRSGTVTAGSATTGNLTLSTTVAGAFAPAGTGAGIMRAVTSAGTAVGSIIIASGLLGGGGSSGTGLGWFDVRTYGAVGDAVVDGSGNWTGTDDTVAFQAAFDACKAAGGGTIYAVGKFMLTAGVLTYNGGGTDDQLVTLRGAGSDTILVADCASTDKLLVLSNLGQFAITDLVIVGSDQSAVADCNKVIYADTVTELLLERVTLIGLQCPDAMVVGLSTRIVARSSYFLGCCVTNAGAARGLIHAYRYPSGLIDECEFVDFGNLGGINYSKTPTGMPSFIYIEDTTVDASVGAPGGGAFLIRNCGFDEGATQTIEAVSSDGIKSNGQIRISGCSFLNSSLASIYIGLASSCVIEQCTFNIRTAANYIPFYGDVIGSLLCRDLRIIGAGTVRFGLDASTQGSGAAEFIDCDRLVGDVFAAFVGVIPPIYITAGGLRARFRLSQAALVANTLGKIGATDGRVDQLGTADSPELAIGVILDAASGAGKGVRVLEAQGQTVSVKSDGAGALAPGDQLTSSGASAGRVKKAVALDIIVGMAYSTAAAAADALVDVFYSKEGAL